MSNLQDCVDATLEDWNNIKEEYNSSGLLIGNGASRAIWDDFRYSSLYNKAKSKYIEHPLLQADKAIFKSMKTKDFERVLAALWTTEVVCKALGRNQTVSIVHERYESIQNALIEAVHDVHVTWSEEVLTKIHSALLQYTSVYSTNYDLLLYWAIMTKKPPKFIDYFWYGDFDITNLEHFLSFRKRILYLHGGLHLVRLPSGETRKLTAIRSNLLDQFGKSLDRGETPLFVTEGTADDKLASINRSSYLSFAYNEFTNHEGDLVVFGHSLDPSDHHLIKAMQQWGKRNIAISIRRSAPNIIERKADLLKQLPDANLSFFKAETHPLGNLKGR